MATSSFGGPRNLDDRVEDAAKLTGLQVNAGKTKMMIMGTLPYGEVTVAGNTIENVDEFCYLGSIIQDDSSCDKDIRARLGKANGETVLPDVLWQHVEGLRSKVRFSNRPTPAEDQ